MADQETPQAAPQAAPQDGPQETRLRDQLATDRDAWKQRVVDERQELKGRVARLESFINSGDFYKVYDNEKALLASQLGHMKQYLSVLEQRVKVLGS